MVSAVVYTAKNCWPRVLGSVVIQLYVGEYTPSVDRALTVQLIIRVATVAFCRTEQSHNDVIKVLIVWSVA